MEDQSDEGEDSESCETRLRKVAAAASRKLGGMLLYDGNICETLISIDKNEGAFRVQEMEKFFPQTITGTPCYKKRVVRQFIAICLFALPLAGCSHNAQNRKAAAWRVWCSPNSTLEQRAHAVSKLVPVGAYADEAMKILGGTNGSWCHFHGITIDAGHRPPRQLPDHDYYCVMYKFPGGGVQLDFDPPTWDGGKFVRCGTFKTLTKVTVTNRP